ncbi:MAG: hypothetical protein J7M03_00995, partial [Candidatus Desulfofervidaceae bacterium]|nr:hypothetical protein [Candidatus Desulfofervidaceae bacterium]
AGGLLASLDLARFGAIFFLRPEGKTKISFSLPPFSFLFCQGRVRSRASPKGAACPKGRSEQAQRVKTLDRVNEALAYNLLEGEG